jgi:hypothetical protein
MNSYKLFLVLVSVIVTGHLFAQSVGINADGSAPNSSAMLDVSAANKGLLIPQIRLTGVNDATTISSPAASLLVYNLTTTNGLVAGYYYNGGTAAAPVWTKLATGALTVGPAGATGVQGIQGIAGAAGAKGDLGLTGATGVQGLQGPIGLTGLQGVPGAAGVNGADGANGLPGTTSATGLTGILPVVNGGTGAATLTANGVLLGNGTSALQAVAPGATGNVLVSDGTTWTSAAGGGGGGGGFVDLTTAQSIAGAKTFSADLTVNSLTLGMGGGSIASNTATGFNALTANTGGNENTANGFNALTANTTGSYNTASGSFALTANTTGYDNTATGAWALIENTSGGNNTETGSEALRENTEGSGNTATGYTALKENTTGDDNTATGYAALRENTTGGANTATGYVALIANTTGDDNTATGYAALSENTEGDDNTATGYAALKENTTGDDNTAIGSAALESNTTGDYNTATGSAALGSNTTGDENTAIGYDALGSNTTGSGNTAFGQNAGYSNTSGDDNTFIGNGANFDDDDSDPINNSTAIGAGALVGADNTIQLGNGSVTKVKSSGRLTTGTVTYPNTHNSISGQVLTTDINGYGSWATASGAHTIGESYGGGIIFYVYDGGKHGLIAATADQSAGVRWSQVDEITTGAKANGIGAGLKNTTIIVAVTITAWRTYNGAGYIWDRNTFAAKICNEYSSSDANGVIFGDWYLPSHMELLLLYQEKIRPGTSLSFTNANYWSSTETGNYDWYTALSVSFTNGTSSGLDKAYSPCRVRPIRAF